MNDRKYINESVSYARLKSAFDGRLSWLRALHDSGKKTVWMMGEDVPEEMILAAGMQPVRMFGDYGECPQADKYLEISFGAQWRGYFQALTGGEYDGLIDYLVMVNSSDLIQKLFYYFEQLRRMEPERWLPEVYYIDYSLIFQDFSAQERNLGETRDFAGKLTEWAGAPISDEALKAACEKCNLHRAAVRRLGQLRRENRILGSEALTAISGSFFMDKDEAVAALNALCDEAQAWPVLDLRKTYFTGSAQETTQVYELMESAGLNVIAEDKIPGDRYADRDVDTALPLMRAITTRYHKRFPSSERAVVNVRAKCLPEAVDESGAKALVIFMNRNDESYIWDYPRQRPALTEMGVTTLTVEKITYPIAEPDALRQRFAEFAAKIGGEANG